MLRSSDFSSTQRGRSDIGRNEYNAAEPSSVFLSLLSSSDIIPKVPTAMRLERIAQLFQTPQWLQTPLTITTDAVGSTFDWDSVRSHKAHG